MMKNNDYSKYKTCPYCFWNRMNPDIHLGKTDIISHQSKNPNENNINHTEEVIIGSEQGTTFPTRIGATMCNALIDTGATRCCMSEKYYKKLQLVKNSFVAKCQCKISYW